MTDDIGWLRIEARYGIRDLWVTCLWDGKDGQGPWVLPDGRDVEVLVYGGRAAELPFPVWFEPFDSASRLSSMLWTGARGTVASTVVVAALESIGATGYSTYEIDLRDASGRAVPGYVGLAVHSASDDTDLRRLDDGPSCAFRARPHVVEALTAYDVTDIVVEPFDGSMTGTGTAG